MLKKNPASEVFKTRAGCPKASSGPSYTEKSALLKNEFESDLQPPGIVCLVGGRQANSSKRATKGRRWRRQVTVIQGVDRLKTNLELLRLREFEILHE